MLNSTPQWSEDYSRSALHFPSVPGVPTTKGADSENDLVLPPLLEPVSTADGLRESLTQQSWYREICSKLLNCMQLQKESTVLYLDCASGGEFSEIAQRISHAGRIVGVDSSRGLLTRAQLELQKLHISGELYNESALTRDLITKIKPDAVFIPCDATPSASLSDLFQKLAAGMKEGAVCGIGSGISTSGVLLRSTAAHYRFGNAIQELLQEIELPTQPPRIKLVSQKDYLLAAQAAGFELLYSTRLDVKLSAHHAATFFSLPGVGEILVPQVQDPEVRRLIVDDALQLSGITELERQWLIMSFRRQA